MFTTHRDAEIPLAPAIAGPHQLWRFVELEQHGPWYYVTINKGRGEENWRSMIFVASEDELEWMLRDIAADARVETVQVITPANMNGTGKWQMEELTELVRIYDAEDKVLGYDLKTASGNIYSDRIRAAAVDAARAQSTVRPKGNEKPSVTAGTGEQFYLDPWRGQSRFGTAQKKKART